LHIVCQGPLGLLVLRAVHQRKGAVKTHITKALRI
jgi:hypothetical protein